MYSLNSPGFQILCLVGRRECMISRLAFVVGACLSHSDSCVVTYKPKSAQPAYPHKYGTQAPAAANAMSSGRSEPPATLSMEPDLGQPPGRPTYSFLPNARDFSIIGAIFNEIRGDVHHHAGRVAGNVCILILALIQSHLAAFSYR